MMCLLDSRISACSALYPSKPQTHHPSVGLVQPETVLIAAAAAFTSTQPASLTSPRKSCPCSVVLCGTLPGHLARAGIPFHLGSTPRSPSPSILSSPNPLANPPFWVHHFLPCPSPLLHHKFQKDGFVSVTPAPSPGWSRAQCLPSSLVSLS